MDVAALEAFVDGVVAAHRSEHATPGVAVSVVGGGRVLFAKGYGAADVEAGRAVDAEATRFRIASVSKTFIWTAVMMLVERGELYDRVCTGVRGRQIEVDGRWLTDFASCNYLGLDLNEDVYRAIDDAIATWGTHPSWARMACSPALYEELERVLADKVGAEDAIVLPTISLMSLERFGFARMRSSSARISACLPSS